MAVASIGDPERMMVAGEHGLKPGRRLANLLPIKPRPLVERLVIGRHRGNQPGDFRDVCGVRGPRFNCHRQGTSRQGISNYPSLSSQLRQKPERAASNSQRGTFFAYASVLILL